MEKEITRNIRVGLFVIIGTILLIIALYLIGDKQNIFGSTFHVSAKFYNVNGLMAGNNVRLSGIDVGTVESVEIVSDSSVEVIMVLEENVREFIKKNAMVSIGTDGLMGNKLVNINSMKDHAMNIEEGDILQTLRPIETDEMIRTLNTTNDNIKFITNDLKGITKKFNSSNSLWSLLMDTIVAENMKQAIVDIKRTSNRSAGITGNLSAIVQDIKSGKGSLGTVLRDTTFSKEFGQTIVDIKEASNKIALISDDLSSVSEKIKNGEGAVGTFLMDTTFVHNLSKSMENIKDGSQGFNDNMEALKHNFLFRRYFKKKEKAKNK